MRLPDNRDRLYHANVERCVIAPQTDQTRSLSSLRTLHSTSNPTPTSTWPVQPPPARPPPTPGTTTRSRWRQRVRSSLWKLLKSTDSGRTWTNTHAGPTTPRPSAPSHLLVFPLVWWVSNASWKIPRIMEWLDRWGLCGRAGWCYHVKYHVSRFFFQV